MTARITYIGHATVLVELAGTRVITDPVLRTQLFGRIISRAGDEPGPIDPPPDAILISHQHPDHLDLPSLRQLGAEIPVIAPRGSGKRLRRAGMKTVHELSPSESTTTGAAEVMATPAEHDGRRYPIGREVPALGYEIRAADTRIYFAGDTDLFDEMTELAGVDVALLPIAGWGTKVGEGHLDPERALEAARRIRPRVVIPIHWGTLLRADLHNRRPELLSKPAEKLVAELEMLPGVDAHILQPGETYTLEP
jgi:L-ascorbate metabolism protein UlaG (beta-lactamase superfamily)